MKKEKEGEALGKNGFCDSCQFLPKSRDVVFSKAKKRSAKGLYGASWDTSK